MRKKRILNRVLACLLTGTLITTPVSTLATENLQEPSDITLDTLFQDEGVSGTEEILGDRYLSAELPDETKIRAVAEDAFPEGDILEASYLRTLEEIQLDLDNDVEIHDSYSIEDVESLIATQLELDDGKSLTARPAYEFHIIDGNGYIDKAPNGIRVTICYPLENTLFDETADVDLFHMKEDGEWEILEVDRDEEKRELSFITDGFSPFVFGHIEDIQTENEDTPKDDSTAEDVPKDEQISEEVLKDESEDISVDASVTEDAPKDESITESVHNDESGTESPKEESVPAETSKDERIQNYVKKDTKEDTKTETDIKEENTKEDVTGDEKGDKVSFSKGLVEVASSEDNALLKDQQLTNETRALMKNGLRSVPATLEPVTADDVTIEKIVMKWLSKSTGSDTAAGYERLELAPTDEYVPAAQWQIDLALSGKHEHEPGSIEIVMPARIWSDRHGMEPGVLTIAVPEDPETGADFAWRRAGDTIILTNTKKLSAATKVMLQGSFRQIPAYDMVDIDVDSASDYAGDANSGVSDELYAAVSVTTPGGTVLDMTSNAIDMSINTYIEAASATKTAYNKVSEKYNLYWDVPADMPSSFLPDSPDDYLYVRWFITGQAQGSQEFVMTATDEASGEYGCRVLGISDADGVDVKSDDGQSVTAQLFSGYSTLMKSAYVWTAYEKSYFTEPMRIYTVHNTQTISLTGVDDLITTTKSADAEASVALPLDYTVTKEWNDNDNARGLRPNHQTIRIYRNKDDDPERMLWKTVNVTEDNGWTYTWNDEGQAWHYEVEEIYMASGSFQVLYDDEGNIYSSRWGYLKESEGYDPDTRTFHFVNKFYTTSTSSPPINELYELVQYRHDDPYQRSKRDRAINELLHGNDIVVPFDVWGTSSDLNAWNDNMDAGDFDTHRVNSVLESSQRTNVNSDILDPVMLGSHRLAPEEDYELAYADLSKPGIYGYTPAVRDASLPEGDPDRYYTDRYTLSKYDDTMTDAVYEGYIDGEWVVLAELHDGNYTTTNGATMRGNRLTLPPNTTRFREIVNTFGVQTSHAYTIGVRIHPSDFVMEQVDETASLSDYMMLTADHFSRLYEMDEGIHGANITAENPYGMDEGWQKTAWDRGYLHGRVFRTAAYQDKSFELTENDTTHRRLTLHTKATTTQQSNVLSLADYKQAIQDDDIPYSNTGTWYDLLPKGVEPDVDTVTLQDGDKITDVYTIDNYRGSGRTMLVVQAKLAEHTSYTDEYSVPLFPDEEDYPQEGYCQTLVIEFDSYYSWQDAKTFGLDNARNTIAFQSDDTWVGNLDGWQGETDDPRSGGNKWTEESVRTDLDIMTNLTSKADDDPSFLYAGALLVYENPDYMAETSIRKWVMAESSGVWTYGHDRDAIVYEGGKYKYRMEMTGDSDTDTKNIIMLDSLENFVPSSDSDDYGDTRWKGHFKSVDIGGLIEAGIEPVVYYSTVPNLDISGYNPDNQYGVVADILENAVTGSGDRVWTTTMPDDPSDVKAIAIDCRKTADGTDFTLTKGETISCYVYMRAPKEEETDNIWCAGSGSAANPDPTQRDENDPDDNAHAYNNVFLDHTQVDDLGRETHGYIHWDYSKVGIIPFNFHVTKDWDDMDDNDGKRPASVTVRLLANGEDTGRSAVLTADTEWEGMFPHVLRYDEDGNWIAYTIEEDEIAGYTMDYSKNGDDIYILNTHEPEKVDIPYEKIWEGDEDDPEARPASINVKLNADGVYTGTKATVREDGDGRWAGAFKDLYKYKNGREVEYTVEEEYVDDYAVTYDEDGDTRIITNTYHPYNDLQVSKTLENATAIAAETDFTFTLMLGMEDGSPLTDKYAYETSDGRTGEIKNGDTFTLKGGQTITIKDIPSHSTYRVVEKAAKGFTNTERTDATGTVSMRKVAHAQFTNTYSSKGAMSLVAKKILNGRELTRYLFRIQVNELLADGTDLGMLRLSTNAADGTVAFGAVRFTDADDGREHIYKLTEVNTALPGYSYDGRTVYAKVTPRDNGDGTMTCRPTYYDEDWNEITETGLVAMADGYVMKAGVWAGMTEGEQEEFKEEHKDKDNGQTDTEEMTDIPATFVNDYTANGAIVLRAWKQMLGRTLTEDEFTFELLDQSSTVIQTAGNTADGSIIFNPVSFTEGDIGRTYYFFVREAEGADGTVNYDDSVYGYDVTVIDNGDGTLQFRQGHQTVEEQDGAYSAAGTMDDVPVFTNKLKDGTLTVSKYTTWQEGDTPNPGQEFRFKVRLINPDRTPFESEDFEYDLEQIENIGARPASGGASDDSEPGDSTSDDSEPDDSSSTGASTDSG